MMTAHEGFQLERRGHTAIVTLANPPLNVWTEASLVAFERLVSELDTDRDIYCLVLTGQGDQYFCAGADLKHFKEGDKAVARVMARRFGAAFERLAAFRGLSVAVLNGFAMGGGLECALACDLRVAEEHAVLALPEAAVGLLPCAGGTQWLSWLVGEAWAKRMVLCGERVDAPVALHIGLVDEVVRRGQGLARALRFCARAEEQSPASVAVCKRLIQGARGRSPRSLLSVEREAFVDLFDTHDQREGVAAFLANRLPVWSNR